MTFASARTSIHFRDTESAPMTVARLCGIALLLGLLLGQPLLALASPVDPSWISGIYDEGDFDDVVGTTTCAIITPGPPTISSAPICVGHVWSHAISVLSQSAHGSAPPRAPPALFS
jgi:hypothetical protein